MGCRGGEPSWFGCAPHMGPIQCYAEDHRGQCGVEVESTSKMSTGAAGMAPTGSLQTSTTPWADSALEQGLDYREPTVQSAEGRDDGN